MKFLVLALFIISIANCQKVTPHYGNPANGCRKDEIDGLMGNYQWCAPNCDTNDCPTDMDASASNVTASCTVETVDGHHYCALVCTATSTCPQGSTCFTVGKTKSFLMARNLLSRERRLQHTTSGLCGYPL